MGGVMILGALFISSLLWGQSRQRLSLLVVMLVTSRLRRHRLRRRPREGDQILDSDGVPQKLRLLLRLRDRARRRRYLAINSLHAETAKASGSKSRRLRRHTKPKVLRLRRCCQGISRYRCFENRSQIHGQMIWQVLLVDLGVMFYMPFAMLIIVGSANAVNLTDGLDGLAIVPVMIAAGLLCGSSPISSAGSISLNWWLNLPYVRGHLRAHDLLRRADRSAGLGFLWYNAPPAMVFMGDTGSLALGGALGSVAVCDQARDHSRRSSAACSWSRRSR